MNRRKKYLKNCISVVALAMALTVSVRPLSVSAENTPDADVLEEESQELPAADLPGGDGELREEQYTSEITEGETPEKEAETAGQDGDEQAEKEAEANGSEDNQENQVEIGEDVLPDDLLVRLGGRLHGAVVPSGLRQGPGLGGGKPLLGRGLQEGHLLSVRDGLRLRRRFSPQLHGISLLSTKYWTSLYQFFPELYRDRP